MPGLLLHEQQCTDSSGGKPASALNCANRSSTCRAEIRAARSVSHTAGWASQPYRGRTSARYSSSACAAHGITVATTRRRGGLPRIALPNRTWQAPNPPSSGAAGFTVKSQTSSMTASRRRSPHP